MCLFFKQLAPRAKILLASRPIWYGPKSIRQSFENKISHKIPDVYFFLEDGKLCSAYNLNHSWQEPIVAADGGPS